MMFGFFGAMRDCVRKRIWPSRRDKRSGVLISSGGTWRFDWPRVDRHAWHAECLRAREDPLISMIHNGKN